MSRSSSLLLQKLQINWVAGLILVLFLLLGIAYSLVIPPFETPDELFHYGFVRHMAEGNALPIQSTSSTGPWEQEGSQAPLFYLLAGWLSSPIDQSDIAEINERNPYANIGSPLVPGNKNFMLYSARPLPLRGANLALHLARWLSLLAGVVTLYFTFLTAQLFFPKRRELALIVLFATAAVPQFAFIAASCSNDMLVTAACTAVIYQLASLWQHGEARHGYGRWLLLGISLGIAALTKLQAFGVIGLSGLTLLLVVWTERSWKQFLLRSLFVGVPLLALAGWWYVRNYLLYGDLLGTGNLAALNGSRNGALTWSAFVDEFRGVRYSFWGLFGWFSIPLPSWFYNGADLFSLLGFSGLLVMGRIPFGKRQVFKPQNSGQGDRTLPVMLLLVFWIVISFALLVYWMSQAMGGQGRLIFPAMGAIMIVLSAGIDAWLGWLPGRWRLVANGVVPTLLFAMSLYSVAILLPASYYPVASVASAPTDAQTVNFRYSDPQEPAVALHLQAVELPVKRVKANGTIPLTLYWRSDTKLKQDYPIFVQLLDETGREVTNLTSHPGWGRNPTRLWLPDTLYPDSYELTIQSQIDNRSPLLARLYTGFIRPGTESAGNLPLTAFDAEGNEVTPFADSLVIEPISPASVADLQDAKMMGATFGGVVQLEAVNWSAQPAQEGGKTLNVTLLWRATGAPATDYTAFVHLLDVSGAQVGGVDHPPAGERLPTHYWQANDTILDAYELTLPSTSAQSEVEIWVGLYESGSGGALRLPVTDAANQPSGDGVVKIGEVSSE